MNITDPNPPKSGRGSRVLEHEPRPTDHVSRPATPEIHHPRLYEINTRCWLNELSTQAGRAITLATIPESEFGRWQQLGFTHIWLMGVWTTGPRGRAAAIAAFGSGQDSQGGQASARPENIAASPYGVCDYTVSPDFGGNAALESFRSRLRANRMKLILDFVPNHVGLDHRWLTERPELFVQGRADGERQPGTFEQQTVRGVRCLAHGRDPYFAPWEDTVQLEYRSPDTRAAMRQVLQSVADRCDGVRCDMAMLVLNEVFQRTWAAFQPPSGASPDQGEFWREAVAAVKRDRPEFLFMAEVYWGLEGKLHELGFDYTYDKTLYDHVVHRDAGAVQGHLLGAGPDWVAASAHFLENHDEPRVAGILSLAEQRAAALLVLSLPGLCLIHEGQMEGRQVKIPVQWARRPDEPRRADVSDMYQRLLTAVRDSAVGRGRARLLTPREAWQGNPTARNFVLIQWQVEPRAFDLVVVNLAQHRCQCYAPLYLPEPASGSWVLKDVLGDERYRRSGKDLAAKGLYLDVPAQAAQLFHFEPA